MSPCISQQDLFLFRFSLAISAILNWPNIKIRLDYSQPTKSGNQEQEIDRVVDESRILESYSNSHPSRSECNSNSWSNNNNGSICKFELVLSILFPVLFFY